MLLCYVVTWKNGTILACDFLLCMPSRIHQIKSFLCVWDSPSSVIMPSKLFSMCTSHIVLGNICVSVFLVAITKYHRAGGLNNWNPFSHNDGVGDGSPRSRLVSREISVPPYGGLLPSPKPVLKRAVRFDWHPHTCVQERDKMSQAQITR